MTERILASKSFVAALLGLATGFTLYFRHPFPADNLVLRLIALRDPLVYRIFLYTYNLFLFTTPYILYSLVLSGLYVFALRPKRTPVPMALPAYPQAGGREDLFLVLGEIHDPRKAMPADQPYWVTIPDRGLFTGIVILGAVGSGKTSGCMYPYVEQMVAYKAGDPERRIGGLALEVKGDFCHKVRKILDRQGRTEDYVEVNLNADHRYNPLYNDLDAYALAYNIASLLNNLFGKGKEPFWQQAYTNLVKFIIQLHKVAYDYVTLFQVYECAINPELLEKRIREAEQLIQGRHYIVVRDPVFRVHPELEVFGFTADESLRSHKALHSAGLEQALKAGSVEHASQVEIAPHLADPLKQEILEGVKRWFYQDWRRIENKLRTSIVEGISVFLSLFDDNPMVKRTFCPPKECYDPELNADGRYGTPLPPFSDLIEA